MSRVGLHKRISVVREALLPQGSFAHRLYHLEPWERQRYNDWLQEVEQHYASIIAERGPSGPFGAYRAAADHRDLSVPTLWPMPLKRKLFPDVDVRGDPEEVWYEMIRADAVKSEPKKRPR